jgi:hypothetical protein
MLFSKCVLFTTSKIMVQLFNYLVNDTTLYNQKPSEEHSFDGVKGDPGNVALSEPLSTKKSL